MSNSLGQVRFQDGSIKYYEYNGTVDVAMPFLYNSSQEVYDNWRRSDWISCSDSENHIHQRVRIASSYGNGFHWDGFACIECNCLLSPLEVNYDTEVSGLPDWWVKNESK